MFHSISFRRCAAAIALVGVFSALQDDAAAQTRAQGRSGQVQSGQARTGQAQAGQARSVENRNVSRTNVNRNAQVNQNVNVNRNVNVNVDDHNDYHPFATAAAVTAGVAMTSAVIGSMVNTLPPSCSPVVVNGITYQQCGSSWYQPQYAGTQVSYAVVNPPQ